MSEHVRGSHVVLERVACELCERDASEEVFLVVIR